MPATCRPGRRRAAQRGGMRDSCGHALAAPALRTRPAAQGRLLPVARLPRAYRLRCAPRRALPLRAPRHLRRQPRRRWADRGSCRAGLGPPAFPGIATPPRISTNPGRASPTLPASHHGGSLPGGRSVMLLDGNIVRLSRSTSPPRSKSARRAIVRASPFKIP